MQPHRPLLAVCSAVLALACSHDDRNPPLNHYADELTTAITDAEDALEAHHEEVLGAGDLEKVHKLEESHMEMMNMRMGMMMDAQDSMERCEQMMNHGNAAPLTSAQTNMGTTIEALEAEAHRHMQAMDAAADLDAALTEEHRHATAMESIVGTLHAHHGEIDDAMQAMEDDGMSMMCSMQSHMHR